MPTRPAKINILGISYAISYEKKLSDVDIHKRKALLGQIDYWTRTIRIYDEGKKSIEEIWQIIMEEILHGLTTELHLEAFSNEDNHDDLAVLALSLADLLFRNNWFQGGQSPQGEKV